MIIASHKKMKINCLTVAFVAKKKLILPFLPISVNFGWLSTSLLQMNYEEKKARASATDKFSSP